MNTSLTDGSTLLCRLTEVQLELGVATRSHMASAMLNVGCLGTDIGAIVGLWLLRVIDVHKLAEEGFHKDLLKGGASQQQAKMRQNGKTKQSDSKTAEQTAGPAWLNTYGVAYSKVFRDSKESIGALERIRRLNEWRNAWAHRVQDSKDKPNAADPFASLKQLDGPSSIAFHIYGNYEGESSTRETLVLVQNVIEDIYQSLVTLAEVMEACLQTRMTRKLFLELAKRGDPDKARRRFRERVVEELKSLAGLLPREVDGAIDGSLSRIDAFDPTWRVALGKPIPLRLAPVTERFVSRARHIGICLNILCQSSQAMQAERAAKIATSVAHVLHGIREIRFKDGEGEFALDHACLDATAGVLNRILEIETLYRDEMLEGREPPVPLLPANMRFWYEWVEEKGYAPIDMYASAISENHNSTMYSLIEQSDEESDAIRFAIDAWLTSRGAEFDVNSVHRAIRVGCLCRDWIFCENRPRQARFAMQGAPGIEGGIVEDDLAWLDQTGAVAVLAERLAKLY